jgi:hypothetical protein
MAEVCYTARVTTMQQVLDGNNKLTLQTNEHGQYTHDAIHLIQKGIQRVFVSQFNPSVPGKGMVKLLLATTYSRKYNPPMRSRLNPFSNWQRNEWTSF